MKRVLITGISGGIGKSVVLKFLENGYSVVGIGKNRPDFENKNLVFIENDFENFVPFEIDGMLDAVVLNSGITIYKKLSQCGLADFEKIFKVNLFGNILSLKCVLKNLRENAVVSFVSSIAALKENTFENWGLYSSSKVAAEKMLEVFAKEEGFKLLILNIGRVNTKLWEKVSGSEKNLPKLSPDYVADFIFSETVKLSMAKSPVVERITVE